MKPVEQCNHCNNRNCKKQVYKEPIMSFVPCRQFIPSKPFTRKLIQCAIYHEAAERGEVVHAGRLH
jgi:hypothetical protein